MKVVILAGGLDQGYLSTLDHTKTNGKIFKVPIIVRIINLYRKFGLMIF